MSTISNLSQVKEAISAIELEEVITPTMPIGVYTREGEELYKWCNTDREALMTAGLDWKKVVELPAACAALCEAQELWNAERNTAEEAEKEWLEESPAAYELRNELILAYRYAYRKYPEISGIVNNIAGNNIHIDVIQDLHNLAVLGSKNPKSLNAINFEFDLLNRAAETSLEMAVLLAKANGEKLEQGETKIACDKAFTYHKQLTDEIRQCGEYVFRKDAERLKGYKNCRALK